ncbi:UNVERIFIED_CONTAM: hypothetical protein NCL1_40447, partial [Trichonephila clavipes]
RFAVFLKEKKGSFDGKVKGHIIKFAKDLKGFTTEMIMLETMVVVHVLLSAGTSIFVLKYNENTSYFICRKKGILC